MEWYKQIDSPILELILPEYELKQFRDIDYYKVSDEISLAVEKQEAILKFIIIYPGYKGHLPYGISWNQNNSDIVSRLGEPDKKTSSKALGIEITYTDMGISIEFINCN